MGIRTYIFLTGIAFGLLPLFILVSLNLPRTVSRFESAALLESRAVSKAGYTRLNAKIQCITKSLQRSATLPHTNEVVDAGRKKKELAIIVSRWFGDEKQVAAIEIVNRQGEIVQAFSRAGGDSVLRPVADLPRRFIGTPPQVALNEPERIIAELVKLAAAPGGAAEAPLYAL